jgi:hypothetical protein
MNIWVVRTGAFTVALLISGVVFYFWGQFAEAMKTALEVPVVQPHTISQPTGEVSVSLPQMQPQKACPKGQTCK